MRETSTARVFLAALGVTIADVLWVIKPAVEPSQHALYHWSGPARVLFAPIAIDVFLAWLLVSALFLIARRPGRARVAIYSGLLLFLPWFALQNAQFLGLIRTQHEFARILFLGALLVTVLLTALWRPALADPFERFVAGATTILVFGGFFGIFLLCRLCWYSWQASQFEHKFPLGHTHAGSVTPPQTSRVIWIVFDELSYQQVFEHRYGRLRLPAMDELAAQSTVFTNVVPIGIYTELVLPGLITGKPVDDMRTSSTGVLSLHRQDSDQWQNFDQHDSVFQDAINTGYTTAVAGWYNPYCQMMAQVLDQCMWTHRLEILNGMVPSGTIASNALAPVKMLATQAITVGPNLVQPFLMRHLHIPSTHLEAARLHIEDYEALDSASNKLLRDRSAGFVLLHLPVPHPGNIFNRTTGSLSTSPGLTYLDNLALADKCFAGLRKTLEQTGQWNASTIVVMGDHSWRTIQIWKATSGWTSAEQAASLDGGYDPRPAYLVKLPGQTTAARVDAVYHALNTRKLFDALLNHRIETPADLVAWAKAAK